MNEDQKTVRFTDGSCHILKEDYEVNSNLDGNWQPYQNL